MRGIRLNRAPAAVRPPAAAGPRRRLHVGTDAGRLWIVVGRWSVIISPRHVLIGLMLLALGLAVAVAALRLGKFTVSTQEVIDALQGRGHRIVQVVVVTWKLPRILLGLVAGLALGVAGAVFQTITRNPLGSPDLICWECQLLGKFAVHASYYKVADSLTYIMQLNSGDLRALKDAHLTFGIPSPLRLLLEDDKIYFYNFGEKSRILQNARLSYEVLWGFYLAAYELVLKNQQKRRNEARALEEPDEDEIDEESLRRTAALNVVLAALDSKGNTFITKEVVTYTDTAYLFRLIGFIKKYIRTEAPEAMAQDLGRFFERLFEDLELPNPQKPHDPMKGMDRNGLLRCVFEKKSIVCRVESFVFKKSLAVDYPSFGRILFFVVAYELVAHCRDSEEGEKRGMATGMTKDQIALAKRLGEQIVLAANEFLDKKGAGFEAKKAVKGDLFALRKTRTATDFLEQLNRLQFRYGIVVNKEIAAGVLAEDDVPFEEFRAYCMIAALNAYNNVMRPRTSGDKDSQSGNE